MFNEADKTIDLPSLPTFRMNNIIYANSLGYFCICLFYTINNRWPARCEKFIKEIINVLNLSVNTTMAECSVSFERISKTTIRIRNNGDAEFLIYACQN